MLPRHNPSIYHMYVQGSSIKRAPGWVNFVPAVAYHFCLNLPAPFSQPGARLILEPCTVNNNFERAWQLAAASQRRREDRVLTSKNLQRDDGRGGTGEEVHAGFAVSSSSPRLRLQYSLDLKATDEAQAWSNLGVMLATFIASFCYFHLHRGF